MEINLVKGEDFILPLLKFKMGFCSNCDFSKDELEVSAFMLNKNKKLLNNDYFVFYNSNLRVKLWDCSKIIFYNRENYPGSLDDFVCRKIYMEETRSVDPEISIIGQINENRHPGGDDNEMEIDLTKVNPLIEEIIIAITIDQCITYEKRFDQIYEFCLKIYNPTTDLELYRYELFDVLSKYTAVELFRFYKNSGEWNAQALENGYSNGLTGLVEKYSSEV